MSKKTLEAVVKEKRQALGLTQREMAEAIGVNSSHIAYIENGQRRPSIQLLRRIADTLVLNRRELLFLLQPDAKYMIGVSDESARANRGTNAWRQFVANRATLRRHGVTRGELNILKRVSLLENVSNPRHFLFILNAIRQAGDRDSWTFD